MKKLRSVKRHILSKQSLVWVATFAVIGVITLLVSHAATGSYSIEPEDGTASGGATQIADASASQGRAIKFGAPAVGGVGVDSSCVFASAPAGTQAAFCDGFNQPTVNPAGSRSGDLNDLIWGTSRARGDGQWTSYDTFNHTVLDEIANQNVTINGGPLCGQSGTFAPPTDIKICNGVMQEGTNSGFGVVSLAMYPKQPFDFAGRTGTVSFDVSLDSRGNHDVWPEFWLTDKPVPDPFKHLTSWASLPKNGFGLMFDASCDYHGGCAPGCPSSPNVNDHYVNVGEGFVIRDYVKQTWNYSFAASGNDGILQTQNCIKEPITGDGTLNHIELRVSQNQIDIWGTDAALPSQLTAAWITANLKHMATLTNVNLNQTRGLIWIEDAQYNPTKGDATHFYHRFYWDNVGFDGPKTYRDLAYDVANVPNSGPAGSDFNPNYAVTAGGSVSLTFKNVNKGTADKGAACTATVPCALLTLNYQRQNGLLTTLNFTLNGHAYSYTLPFNDTLDLSSGLDNAFDNSPRTIAIPITIGDVVSGDNVLNITSTTGDTVEYRNLDLIMVNAAPVP